MKKENKDQLKNIGTILLFLPITIVAYILIVATPILWMAALRLLGSYCLPAFALLFFAAITLPFIDFKKKR